MPEPKKLENPGDGGFSNPRVFDTIEEAMAAPDIEEEYLASLDKNDDEGEDQ